METKYKNMRGMKAAIGGLVILAGIISGLEIIERNTSSEIPIYTATKRYIELQAANIYLKTIDGSEGNIPSGPFF